MGKLSSTDLIDGLFDKKTMTANQRLLQNEREQTLNKLAQVGYATSEDVSSARAKMGAAGMSSSAGSNSAVLNTIEGKGAIKQEEYGLNYNSKVNQFKKQKYSYQSSQLKKLLA